jgi:chromosome segregation protein
MRLQSLRIKGFKSFANETVINFDDNLIGVVGPNGSGKSNIVDSIRWVLGEQKSSELRLKKMSDVLFNGTKTRKPAGVSQVTLVFENTKNLIPIDFDTVSISRLLYRNGDSEYRLNNVTCRKKDITNLFLDSGIGSNSYAIIELAMVDTILQNKDHSRRKMFEQGAGISKYKVRKRETQQKLNNTQNDLERLEDIIFELENNLKSLERQAKRAEKFIQLKAEYKEKSIVFTRFQIKDLEDKFSKSKVKIEDEEVNYAKIKSAFLTKESELEKFKTDNLQKEQSVSAKQKGLNQLFDTIRLEENKKNINEEKIQFNKNSLINLENSISFKNNRVASLEKEMLELNTELSTVKLSATEISTAFLAASNIYQDIRGKYTQLKEDFNKNKKQIWSLEEQKTNLEKQKAIEENKLDTNKNRLQMLHKTSEEKAPYLKELRDQLAKTTEVLTQLEQQETEQNAKLEAAVNNEKELRLQLDGYRSEISAVDKNLERSMSERDLLKNMIENLEGFPESIKYLNKKWEKDAVLLTDIIDYDESYRICVEQYFEKYINYFVVNNAEDGLDGLNLLKKTQSGKASFLVLDEIKNGTTHSTSPVDNCIALESVIECKTIYKDLIAMLTRNVYIVEDNKLDNLSKDQLSSYTFISKDGSIIKSPGEIKGGSLGLFEGKKLGRKKALDKLEQKIKTLEKSKQELEDNLNEAVKNLQAINIPGLRYELSEIKSKNYNYSNQKTKLDTEIKNQNESISGLNEDIEEEKKSIETSTNNLVEIANELDGLQEKFSDLSVAPEQSEEEIIEIEKELGEKSQIYNDLQIQDIKQQGLVDKISTDLDYIKKQISENKESIYADSQRLVELKSSIDQAGELVKNQEQKLVELYEQKSNEQKVLGEQEQEYYAVRNQINEQEEEIRNLNRKQQQSQTRLNELKEDHHGYQLNMNSAAERMKIEFDLEIADILKEKTENEDQIDFTALGEKLNKVKNRLSNFGEVNPMAVTAYNEMKERLDEIIVQRADILKAKESLLETILEIETDAVEKFSEAFTQISANFKKVFRSLFSEDDDCDLVLLDPEHPLESDIEIVAKPKGKRPKSLAQLSGGEKTLTATALLFSLYLLKPAPFCILDEVDAPLDDANVLKFTKLINAFKGESQFILITHNKASMAAVDVLYGVYMQEQGVSGISPVDFRNYEYQPILNTVNN